MFDKQKLAELILSAKGESTFNDFGLRIDVSPVRISRYTRCLFDAPPMKKELKKLASDDNMYQEMLAVCGYEK